MPSVINSVIFKNMQGNLNGKFYTLSCCSPKISELFINKSFYFVLLRHTPHQIFALMKQNVHTLIKTHRNEYSLNLFFTVVHPLFLVFRRLLNLESFNKSKVLQKGGSMAISLSVNLWKERWNFKTHTDMYISKYFNQ